MCGHGPFELTAIVVAGGAGLQMGYAIVNTGELSRLASLRAQAPQLVTLILGAGMMLAIAAVIEGYWSPSSALPEVKWAFSGLATLAVIGYLGFAGREGPA